MKYTQLRRRISPLKRTGSIYLVCAPSQSALAFGKETFRTLARFPANQSGRLKEIFASILQLSTGTSAFAVMIRIRG